MPREYPTQPMIGAGAVVIAQERVLLVRRGNPPLAGEWSLPGGRLELGESVTQAIVREVLEETGLNVEPLQLLGVYDLIDRDEEDAVRYHYVLVDWICRPVTGQIEGAMCAGDDAMDVCWAARGDLRQFALADFTLEAIEKAFGMMDVLESARA
ncbi:MAG TPA: NUDIX hydrolase [Acidobacteriaceae bacterium]